MILRLLFSLFLILPLYGADDSWYNKVKVSIEADIYKPVLLGNIHNIVSKATFKDDLAYNDAKASKFVISLDLDYAYVPKIDISYFNLRSEKSVLLTKSTKIANGLFSSSVISTISYQAYNIVLYQDFKLKGKRARVFGIPFYTGDFEFDVGLNTQVFQWNYNIRSLSNTTQTPSWIHVNAFLPLPYIGAKYFWYNYRASAKASALAFGKAKSSVYEASVDYRLVNGLYISAGYLYEEFKTVEQSDTVNFITSGYKFGFKYTF